MKRWVVFQLNLIKLHLVWLKTQAVNDWDGKKLFSSEISHIGSKLCDLLQRAQ